MAWAALCMLPDPPAPARETPAQRSRPAEGRAGLSGTGFPAPLPAGGPGHGGAGTLGWPGCGHWAGSAASEGPTDATSARTTGAHAPARRRWPGREDRVLRPHRGSRAIAAAPLRPSERPGPGDRGQARSGAGGPSPDRLAQVPAPLLCGVCAGSNPRTHTEGPSRPVRKRGGPQPSRYVHTHSRAHAQSRARPGR